MIEELTRRKILSVLHGILITSGILEKKRLTFLYDEV
jgi:hypothetical protein